MAQSSNSACTSGDAVTRRRWPCVVATALCLWLSACGDQRTTDTSLPDDLAAEIAGKDLLWLLSTFHRHPVQGVFDHVLSELQRQDSNPEMQANAGLMAAFLVLAVEHHGLSVDRAPESRPLKFFRTADRAAFHQWIDDQSASPQKNDAWWIAFFCTGDERYLDRLLQVASAPEPTADNDRLVIDLAVRTAKWSYQSNVAQWPEVERHARRHAAAGNPFAAQCLAYAAEHPDQRQ